MRSVMMGTSALVMVVTPHAAGSAPTVGAMLKSVMWMMMMMMRIVTLRAQVTLAAVMESPEGALDKTFAEPLARSDPSPTR
jgi:hypothetical protein